MSQLSTSFAGTIIENLRLKIQEDHKNQSKSSSEIKRQLNILERIVKKESETVDLKGVYICLGVIIGMICLVLWASNLVKNGVIQHLMKMQVRNTPRPGSQNAMRLLNRQPSFQDAENFPGDRANSCVRAQSVIWTRDQQEEPIRNHLPRRQSTERTRPNHD